MSDFRNPNWQGRGPTDSQSPRGPTEASQSEGERPGAGQAKPVYRSRRSRSGHHSSRTSQRKIRNLRILAGLLAAGMVASIVVSVMLYFQTQSLRDNQGDQTVAQRQLEGELAKARERITELNNDLRILLANRLPGVDELLFNRQIELNDQYVKSITFVKSGLGEERTIEFSTVLQNARTGPILPKVSIALFDESGLQTGIANLDRGQTITPVDIPEMQPGETRTYSAQIKLARQTPSKYFVVEVR